MIYKNDILADMHTHTHFSLHGYSTVKENIDVAKERGLKYLVISDHFYGNGDELELKNEINRIKYLEERVNPCETDIKVIGSAEFNIGQVSDSLEKLAGLKWRPIGLHNWFIDTNTTTLNDLSKLILNLANSKNKLTFNALVHIERELHKIDNCKHGSELTSEVKEFLTEVVKFCKTEHIYMEVNESSLVLNEGGSVERLKYWLSIAKTNGNMIYMGSDAHYCKEVGVFNKSIDLLNDIDYPKEWILNCNNTLLDSLI